MKSFVIAILIVLCLINMLISKSANNLNRRKLRRTKSNNCCCHYSEYVTTHLSTKETECTEKNCEIACKRDKPDYHLNFYNCGECTFHY